MDKISVDPDPAAAPRDVGRRLERVRDALANDNPYSPLLCLSLLLGIGLVITFAKSPLLLASLAF